MTSDSSVEQRTSQTTMSSLLALDLRRCHLHIHIATAGPEISSHMLDINCWQSATQAKHCTMSEADVCDLYQDLTRCPEQDEGLHV
mmetsp:Transcript_13576/g.29050  ORF Transcript_13576/g.29050 Transcript_13576/m.29050 type:complete len:86 (-) Transcript_13576:57-314(-)